MIAALLLAEVIGLTALILSVYGLSVRVNDVAGARVRARYNTCQVLQNMIRLATPPDKTARAKLFLKRTHLDDCRSFARS